MGTGVNSRLEGPKARKLQDQKNAHGRLATKVNNAWTTALASRVVELGGVPITKEEIKKQMLADDDDDEEEEAGPSNKKLKKGGQQKINFPVAKAAATHPASTGIMGLLIVILIMGIKTVGAKKM